MSRYLSRDSTLWGAAFAWRRMGSASLAQDLRLVQVRGFSSEVVSEGDATAGSRQCLCRSLKLVIVDSNRLGSNPARVRRVLTELSAASIRCMVRVSCSGSQDVLRRRLPYQGDGGRWTRKTEDRASLTRDRLRGRQGVIEPLFNEPFTAVRNVSAHRPRDPAPYDDTVKGDVAPPAAKPQPAAHRCGLADNDVPSVRGAQVQVRAEGQRSQPVVDDRALTASAI